MPACALDATNNGSTSLLGSNSWILTVADAFGTFFVKLDFLLFLVFFKS